MFDMGKERKQRECESKQEMDHLKTQNQITNNRITDAFNDITETLNNIKCLEEKFTAKMNSLAEEVKKVILAHKHPAPDIDNKLKEYSLDTDKKLVDFHKEITDKCFSSMESIMKYSKEVSLITTLAENLKDRDLVALQTQLMKPVLDQKWEQSKQDKINKTDKNAKSMGGEIVNRRKILHDKYLEMNKHKQNTKEIEGLISQLDWIIQGKK